MMTERNEHIDNAIKERVARYPWWCEARLTLYRHSSAEADDATKLCAMLHPTATIALHDIDITRLTHLSDEDLIERFLKRGDYRIVAEEGAAEDLSKVEIEDDEEFVSEELAEIYLKQGLYDEAIDTYRKLSLLNSEKSIYFAGLIAGIEDKRNK